MYLLVSEAVLPTYLTIDQRTTYLPVTVHRSVILSPYPPSIARVLFSGSSSVIIPQAARFIVPAAILDRKSIGKSIRAQGIIDTTFHSSRLSPRPTPFRLLPSCRVVSCPSCRVHPVVSCPCRIPLCRILLLLLLCCVSACFLAFLPACLPACRACRVCRVCCDLDEPTHDNGLPPPPHLTSSCCPEHPSVCRPCAIAPTLTARPAPPAGQPSLRLSPCLSYAVAASWPASPTCAATPPYSNPSLRPSS